MNSELPIAGAERMESLILTIRDQRVMLDATLATIYGVPLKALNQQVKRNSAPPYRVNVHRSR